MRDFIFAANWKMHKSPTETASFFKEFIPSLETKLKALLPAAANGGARRVVFFVPALSMSAAQLAVTDSTAKPHGNLHASLAIELGGQNIHSEIKGAFTGENSAAVLKSMGAAWALIGHSERRTFFGETDEVTGFKMKTALENDLSAMLCVGETLAERESNQTIAVVERQLTVGFSKVIDVAGATPRRIAIAYEPVWAIGTGKVASPEQASEVHRAIRSWLAKTLNETTAQNISILYGGSVKPDNAASIAAKSDIDGFLVGGASLESAAFLGLF